MKFIGGRDVKFCVLYCKPYVIDQIYLVCRQEFCLNSLKNLLYSEETGHKHTCRVDEMKNCIYISQIFVVIKIGEVKSILQMTVHGSYVCTGRKIHY